MLRAEYLALAVAREDWGKAASKAKHYPRPIAKQYREGKLKSTPKGV